jgi:hypothetical protein
MQKAMIANTRFTWEELKTKSKKYVIGIEGIESWLFLILLERASTRK